MPRTNITPARKTHPVSCLTEIAQDRGWNPNGYLGTGIGFRAERFWDAVRLLDPHERGRALVCFLHAEGVALDVAWSLVADNAESFD